MTPLLPAFYARFGSLGENYICKDGEMIGLLALCDMLNDLLRLGVCVVEQAPSALGFLNERAARIGPVRDSNFGSLWDVKADVNLAGDAKTNTECGIPRTYTL